MLSSLPQYFTVKIIHFLKGSFVGYITIYLISVKDTEI